MSTEQKVSGLIINPHKWPERSVATVQVENGNYSVVSAETTLYDGNAGVAEFAEDTVLGAGIGIALQQESCPGYSPTNWMPNIVSTALLYCWEDDDSYKSGFKKLLEQFAWGDGFVFGVDEIDGVNVYRDLTPGEEDRVLKFLLEFNMFF